MQTPSPLPSPAQRPTSSAWPLLLLTLTLLVQLLFHLLLAGNFLFKSSVADRSITLLHWRTLDQYIGWIALTIFLFANPHAPADRDLSTTRLVRRAAGIALALGIALLTFHIARQIGGWQTAESWRVVGAKGGTWGLGGSYFGPPLVEQTLAILLGLSSALLCLDQLAALSRNLGQSGGLTLEQLWRLVTVQWILVWTAAEIFLRFKWAHKGGLAGIESDNLAKNLLFALPAFALFPNLLMALGLRWLPLATPATTTSNKPSQRTRALLIASLAVNLAAICFTVGDMGFRWLAVLGILPLAFAILMYLMAFRAGTWRRHGRAVLLALALLLVGALMFAGERIRASEEISLWREYSAAWRFLLGFGVPLIWLCGMGGIAVQAFVPKRLQSDLAIFLATTLITLGTLATVFTLAMAGLVNREWLTGVSFGCTLLILGVFIGCAAMLRTKPWRYLQQKSKTSD